MTTLYGLDTKYVYIKRTLFKQLHGGDALSNIAYYQVLYMLSYQNTKIQYQVPVLVGQ